MLGGGLGVRRLKLNLEWLSLSTSANGWSTWVYQLAWCGAEEKGGGGLKAVRCRTVKTWSGS